MLEGRFFCLYYKAQYKNMTTFAVVKKQRTYYKPIKVLQK